MTRGFGLLTILFFFGLAAPALCTAGTPPITVQIVNNSGVSAQNIWVLLTGDSAATTQVAGIEYGKPTLLSAIANSRFTLSAITAGRITFSYNGPVAFNQQPLTPSPRFDKVELTYPGKGNLTAVDFFGIPFKMETLDASGNVIQTLNYYTSKNTIAATLLALAPGAQVNTAAAKGSFARILSPSLKPAAFPSLQNYVKSVYGQSVTIAGTYVGKIPPTPDTYKYAGTFGSKDGTITLTGTLSAIPNPPTLTIQGSTLASAAYTNNGPYLVGKAQKYVASNDVYAAIYRDLISGFDFGYLGGRYGSNSGSWYGTTPYRPPYAAARRTNDGFFNRYASIFAANSDAYGFPFQDVNQTVHVDLNSGAVANVAALRITILPDGMMDAPIISSASSTQNSITVNWAAITGATDYSVVVSPPMGSTPISTKGKTSCAIPKLTPGTPYTVSVTASSPTESSAAIPVIISTTGTSPPVTGQAKWNFIPNFTGTFSGHKITFNGRTVTLPATANPAVQFNNVQGQPGHQNAYVFRWTDNNGNLIFSSILYVTLENTVDPQGYGSIVQDATQTFMASNQNTPTYMPNGFNLFLSIAPEIQRTFVPNSLFQDKRPAQFGPLHAMRLGTQMLLSGTVREDDGLRGVSVTVTTVKGVTTVCPARVKRSQWTARVRTFYYSKKLNVIVTVMDKKGNISRKSYVVKGRLQ